MCVCARALVSGTWALMTRYFCCTAGHRELRQPTSPRTVACYRVGLTGQSSRPRTPPADAVSAQQVENPASTAEDDVNRVNLTDPKFVVWFLTVPVVLLVAWAHTLGFL